MSKVLVVSDIHFPFHCKNSLKKLLKIVKEEKPTHVVQIGDLLDQYVYSKYSKSSDITPKDDILKGLDLAVEFWATIKKLVPKAKRIQVLGNHDVRASKRIGEKIPELFALYNPLGIYQFKGVKTLKSDRDFIEIDGVVYCHGWLSKSIDHAKYFNKPVAHGHRHRPTIEYDSARLWSMDVGYMADPKSVPLSYTMSKLSKWTKACGIVENGKPKLIVLE